MQVHVAADLARDAVRDATLGQAPGELGAIVQATSDLGDTIARRLEGDEQLFADMHRFIMQVEAAAKSSIASVARNLERIPTPRALDRDHAAINEVCRVHFHAYARVHRRVDECEMRIDSIDMSGRAPPKVGIEGAPVCVLPWLPHLDMEAWCLRLRHTARRRTSRRNRVFSRGARKRRLEAFVVVVTARTSPRVALSRICTPNTKDNDTASQHKTSCEDPRE